MLTIRITFAVTAAAIGLILSGCGGTTTTFILGGASKHVTEERNLNTPHLPGSGLEVKTPNGSIEVVADASLTEVKVTAKITAFGETEEEARARLTEIKVIMNRRKDKMLEIDAELPKDQQGVRGACSFIIRLPEVKGCKARSGSGSITLNGLGGHADVQTDNGSVTIKDAGGPVKVKSGSGSLTITKSAGDVDARTDNGSVTVNDAGGAVKVKSGSGSLTITKSSGDIDLHTDNGSVKVAEVRGSAKIKSGSGSLEITKTEGTVVAHTDNGPVTVQDASGDVNATSGSGRVTLKRVTGTAKANTSNGPVSLEQVAGPVEAESGSGSINYTAAAESNSSFNLKTSNGSVTVRLPASVGGTIKADTDNGRITVDGSRKPATITGDKGSKQIMITDKGPQSKLHSGSGSITITLE